MGKTVQLLAIFLWGYFVPAGLMFTLPKFALGNVSEPRSKDDALRLVFSRTSFLQCFLIVIRDGYLPQSFFPQVSGSRETGYTGLAASAIFESTLNTEGSANMSESLMVNMVDQARRLRQLAWCVTVVVLSDDPAFLAAFAEASDRGRMLVWETRLLVVTRVAMPSIRRLLQDYWTFSMMNTMFLTPNGKSLYRWQGYVHLPYSPTGAQVKIVGSWERVDNLLTDDEKLFPQKYKNFYGMDVNMTWFPLPPHWIPVSGSESDNYKGSTFVGRDVNIFEAIREKMNFSIHLVPYRGVENWMIPLRTREALLRPINLPIMPHMLEEFDITFFVEPSSLSFAMNKPTLKPSWQSLFYPLQPDVWGYVTASVIMVIVVLLMMKSEGEDSSQEAWMVMKQVFGTLLDEAIPGELPRRNSTRLALTAWLIAAFIVGTVYRSNLTACLTVPTYPKRAENLVDLFHTGVKITIIPVMVMFYTSFKESGSEVLETLAERMEYVPTSVEGLRQSVTENKAYLYERLNMELLIAEHFTSKDGSTPLYVTQRNFMSVYSTFILGRNIPFKANIDHIILNCHEGGLITKWTADIMATMKGDIMKAKGKSEMTVEEEKIEEGILALTLVHMLGPFLLYSAGIIAAFTAFLCENISVVCSKNLFLIPFREKLHFKVHP